MKSISFVTATIFLHLLCSCNKSTTETACVDETQINQEVMCTMQYDPVCGCDNKTYGNECEARKSGVQKWTMGECPD